MANVIEVVNEATGEVQHLDTEKNYLDYSLYGGNVSRVTDAQMKSLRRETKWLLHQYGYNTEAIDDVLTVWEENKRGAMNLLARHPQWDPEKFMVKYEIEVERHISKSGIHKFVAWVRDNIYTLPYWEQYLSGIDITAYNTMVDLKNQYYTVSTRMQEFFDDIAAYKDILPQETDDRDEYEVKVRLNGKNRQHYVDQENKLRDAIDKFYVINGKVYDRETMQPKIENANRVFNWLDTVDKQFIDSELAATFNSYLKEGGFETEAKKGQKISKFISKFCIEIGMDKVKDEQDMSFTDQNGEQHIKKKDMGYNYHFYSVFADAVNPTKKKMFVCFSVNLIDYLTMSFGNSWASCQTIDVDQLRKAQGDGTHNYHGMYSSGTLSYGLDSSTIVMYYVNPEDKAELENGIANPELKDKFKRCLFYIGENKIIQSRVYPDGRNKAEGNDEDDIATQLSKDMRAQFEEMISKCMNVPNNWVYKSGTDTAGSVTQSTGTHYRDYTSYSDCGTAFLKIGPRLVKNTNKIKIGHMPICPSCGEEHKNGENIQCCDCITRDYEGKLVTRIGAFKLGSKLFKTYEERKQYVEMSYMSTEWDELWDKCATNDAQRLSKLTEDAYPTTPFVETKSETENEVENTPAESDSAVA